MNKKPIILRSVFALLVLGVFLFQKVEKNFADVI